MTKFKICTKCGIEKPIEEFSIRNSSKLDNRQARCKGCNKQVCRDWRKNNDCNKSRKKQKASLSLNEVEIDYGFNEELYQQVLADSV